MAGVQDIAPNQRKGAGQTQRCLVHEPAGIRVAGHLRSPRHNPELEAYRLLHLLRGKAVQFSNQLDGVPGAVLLGHDGRRN